jgi:hypothetical protein
MAARKPQKIAAIENVALNERANLRINQWPQRFKRIEYKAVPMRLVLMEKSNCEARAACRRPVFLLTPSCFAVWRRLNPAPTSCLACSCRADTVRRSCRASNDWDQANACALWDFACAKFARAAPATLAVFEARP